MSQFQLQRTVRANAFRSAMNELSQLAVAGVGKGTGLRVSEAVRRLAENLRYARASRVQLVVTDWLLQREIEYELRRIRPRTARNFLEEIHRNPRAVMRLPGIWRVRQRIVESVQSDVYILQKLVAIIRQSGNEVRKDKEFGNRASPKSLTVISRPLRLATFCPTSEASTKSTEADANPSENEVKEIAIGVAIIVGVQVDRGLDALGLPDQIGDLIGDNVSEQGVDAVEQVDETAKCMEEAGHRLDSCNSLCPPGSAGNSCRGICGASYVADLANCMVS